MHRVEHFYNTNVDAEWIRLDRHRTEFAVTLRVLAEFLLPPPATLLDVGGGPGRYAITLAQQGYHVTLVDLAQQNLTLAGEQARMANVSLAGCVCANALDLSMFPDTTFDAVLLLGPLYHLLSASERQRAVQEALRVLNPAGILAVAFITRFAPFRTAARENPLKLVQQRAHVEQMLRTGEDTTSSDFPHVYFAHPLEVQPFMELLGTQMLSLVGCEGVIAGMEELVNALDGEAWETWVDWNYRLGQDAALHGAADHLLYVGKKL
ncbi:MAG: class I SAM-dependent methyltransferase [Chloroflexota bacterium]|nr:class I SAM-dependent methyltransferase [Chloroflexota bacterium]